MGLRLPCLLQTTVSGSGCLGLPAPELDFQSTNSAQSQSENRNYVTTDGQLASLYSCRAPSRSQTRFLLLSDSCGFVDKGRPLMRGRVLSFAIAAGVRQRSHFRVRVPRDLRPYFTVLDLGLPQPGGPDPRIDIPQERSGPVTPPGTGFLFVVSCYSQRYGGGILTRLHTDVTQLCFDSPDIASGRHPQKTPLLVVASLQYDEVVAADRVESTVSRSGFIVA
jgi:hypothetical protein